MQKSMLSNKKEEQKKKLAKLGPSTIRTLIRAADSRIDWLNLERTYILRQKTNIL